MIMSKIHLKSFGLKSHGVISMALKSVFYFSFLILPLFTLFSSCAISYKFNGASIDYSKTKTIQIDPFPIRSTYVWAPMQSIFNNKLTDLYAQQTKLKQVKRGGDLVVAGEITGFDQYNKGVSADGYSSQVQLKMTVNVRFTNTKNHKEDFERQFSATTEYDASQQLIAVQEELVTQMTKDICEQIFNATVANW
ncbi:MAG: LptE family protein [Bacteroidaceae bacterium]|nr:LptE family protein [Bacteroidaceae bacterium]MBR1791300.1 LptE family protein [Bacteroidaceae bacterium]